MTEQYSTVQKLSLAGMVVGGILCLVGAASPYWIVSDPQGFSFVGQLIGKVVKAFVGLYMFCIEAVGEKECTILKIDGHSRWYHVARANGVVCVLLGMLCGLISLCLACCTCCKRFTVVGIMAFFAAAAGAICAITFSKNMDVFTTSIFDYKLASFGWGFYVFSTGVGVLGIVSFAACFSAPDNPIRGLILSQPAALAPAGNQNPGMNLQEQHGVGIGNSRANPGFTVATGSGY